MSTSVAEMSALKMLIRQEIEDYVMEVDEDV